MHKVNKTALITGSGQNIGRGVAHELASAGINIIINGKTNEIAAETVAAEMREYGVDAIVAMGNIGLEEEAEAVVNAGIKKFGHINILINNAAIRPHSPFLETSKEQWAEVINTNMNGPIWLAKKVIPSMLEEGWGRIINFTGMNAQRGFRGASAVSVSKHALWGLTKTLAMEFGQKGITSNIISPGTFPPDDENISTNQKFQELLKSNPSGRLGHPSDIGGIIAFLCSDKGGFINGQMLQINGGAIVQY